MSRGCDKYSRILAWVSIGTLLIGVLATVWRFFASQSPSSPLHLGPLFGPIDSLALSCWIAGFGGFSLSVFIQKLDTNQALAKRAIVLLVAGWVILLAGFVTGAFLGTTGTQVLKAYPRTIAVLFIKTVGFLSVFSGLLHLVAVMFRSGGGGNGD